MDFIGGLMIRPRCPGSKICLAILAMRCRRSVVMYDYSMEMSMAGVLVWSA